MSAPDPDSVKTQIVVKRIDIISNITMIWSKICREHLRSLSKEKQFLLNLSKHTISHSLSHEQKKSQLLFTSNYDRPADVIWQKADVAVGWSARRDSEFREFGRIVLDA